METATGSAGWSGLKHKEGSKENIGLEKIPRKTGLPLSKVSAAAVASASSRAGGRGDAE